MPGGLGGGNTLEERSEHLIDPMLEGLGGWFDQQLVEHIAAQQIEQHIKRGIRPDLAACACALQHRPQRIVLQHPKALPIEFGEGRIMGQCIDDQGHCQCVCASARPW